MSISSRVHNLIQQLQDSQERHIERYRPTGFGFALADCIAYLPHKHWDEVTQSGSYFLQRDYLELMERYGPKTIHHRYALIYRGRTPIAAVVTQLVEVQGKNILASEQQELSTTLNSFNRPFSFLPEATKKLRKFALDNITARILVCGNLLSWGLDGVAVAPNESLANLWPAIAEAMYRIRRADKLWGEIDYALIKDLAPQLASIADPLRVYSYRPLQTEPNMILDLPEAWRSYQDYLVSLNTKYRKAARRVVREIEKAGYHIETIANLEPSAEQLHRLYQQVEGRASVRLASIPVEYLPMLAQTMGTDRFRCTVIRRDDEIVAFSTTLRDGKNALGYYLGFDYSTNENVPLYLCLLHNVVADSIHLRGHRLSLGRTALEPKARLGARPEPQQIWLRHRLPVLNLLVRELLQIVPHDEAPERDPFKTNVRSSDESSI